MKQVLATIASFVLGSPLHVSTYQKRPFSKYCSLILLAGLVLFIGGCQKDSPFKKPVPFKGQMTVSSTESGTVGTGEGTPIGKFSYASQDNFEKFPTITCTTIMTAGNGDQLFGTQTGIAQDMGNGIAKVDFDNTIKGGTGRFAEATGSLKIHVIVNTALGTGSATFDGTISY